MRGRLGAAKKGGMKALKGLALIVVVVLFSACSKQAVNVSREAAPLTFEVRGILRAIDFAGQSVTVEHEEIPRYMPAMTMPFNVKTMSEVEPLRAGDGIGFRLVVNDKTSWIEGVRKVDPATVQLSQKHVDVAFSGESERLKEGDHLPAFQLVDSKNREITRDTFAGKPLLLTFIFTRCPIPNFCPLMTDNFRQIEQVIAAEPLLAEQLQLLSISFDSEFDTPEVLAKYGARHTQDMDRWRFATGAAGETQRLTKAFSVYVQPESGTISHGLCTALVGADGTIRKLWRGNAWKPEEVIAALREMKSTTSANLH